MATVRVKFSLRTFETEIILDAENEDDVAKWLEANPEKWGYKLVERADFEVTEGEYDEPENEEEEE